MESLRLTLALNNFDGKTYQDYDRYWPRSEWRLDPSIPVSERCSLEVLSLDFCHKLWVLSENRIPPQICQTSLAVHSVCFRSGVTSDQCTEGSKTWLVSQVLSKRKRGSRLPSSSWLGVIRLCMHFSQHAASNSLVQCWVPVETGGNCKKSAARTSCISPEGSLLCRTVRAT